MRSKGNPAYWEGNGRCNCADGIYVDGGTHIVIRDNHVTGSDIGVEVAAENARGSADHVLVRRNLITGSLFTGLTTGGYCNGARSCGGVQTGTSHDNVFEDNRLRGNNQLDDGSPELLVQYHAYRDVFRDNDITATNRAHVVYGTVPNSDSGRIAPNHSDHNTFSAVGVGPAGMSFGWRPGPAQPVPLGRILWRTGRRAVMLDRVLNSRDLLAAYDDQLRTDAETPSAISVTELGPLRLVTFDGGRGFVTYRDLGGADAQAIASLVAGAVEHYGEDPDINEVEWKTRGHDRAPGLHEALLDNGFEPDDPESIMIGEAQALDVDVPLPAGVTLRRVTEEDDVRTMSAMQDAVFGDPVSDQRADALVNRLARDDGMELWVAEAAGEIVSAGRLEPVDGSDFAGIWGGATLEAWRGQGIYRALTAARARSALVMGKTLIHSDSTEYSRPILERSGLVKVSTTTPYEWKRSEQHKSANS